MVQSLGISVGNSNSYVAAGQGGGIEILLNEYSNRSTPSMVAFTDHSRSIGVDAANNIFMNIKNTIYDIMVLVGRPYKEIISSEKRLNYPFKLEEADDGQALVVIRHLGVERKFNLTQILGMLFTKLRGVASGARDCVISCPQFFGDNQKAALVSAALIAGLNPLQIISDMSAVVLNYAYYRTTKEDTHKIIAFINFGHSNLQSVVAWLNPREDIVQILAAESESIGGRDFDKILADHFVKEHKLTLTPKSYLKLVFACEKLKKLLSATANEIPLHVESLISEDQDFTARIDRATFEEVSKNLLNQIESCFKKTLANAKANFDKMIAEVKEVNGSIAANKEQAKEAASVPPSNAPNTEEAAARDGAALNPEMKGDEAAKAVDVEMVDGPTKTPANKEQAQNVSGVPPSTNTEEAASKEGATLHLGLKLEDFAKVAEVEMVGGTTRIPAIKQLVQDVFSVSPSTTLNTDEAVARGCVLQCATLHPGMKVKREVKIIGSDTFVKPGSLTCDEGLRRVELELVTSDSKYKSRTEARNNLEEYIYSERSKLQQGDGFLDELAQTLDWLFSDEGEDASEEDYNNKLNGLKKASEERLKANNNK